MYRCRVGSKTARKQRLLEWGDDGISGRSGFEEEQPGTAGTMAHTQALLVGGQLILSKRANNSLASLFLRKPIAWQAWRATENRLTSP